jgi:hypothetical protein
MTFDEDRIQRELRGILALPAGSPEARSVYVSALCASESLELASAVIQRYGESEPDGPRVFAEFLRTLVVDEGPGPGDMLCVLNAVCETFRQNRTK